MTITSSRSSSVLDDAPLTSFHKRLALYSSGGPFLDGYVLSMIGIAMVQVTPQFGLSPTQQGLIGASSLIGVFLGALLGGWLTDKFGRQILYTVDLIAIILCSGAQFWVEGFLVLFIMRLLIGMAIGADYPVATSLLAEFTPRKSRGPLLGGLIVAWFVGAATAYGVGEVLLRSSDSGWRWMLVSAAVPATIIVLLRLGTPESPRWLMSKGRVDEANAVIRKVFGDNASVEDLPGEAKEGLNVMALARSGYLGRMIFVSIFWTCSIVPLFAIYAFGPQTLSSMNLHGNLENIGSALITVMLMIGCIAALIVVNKLGRRQLLIHSFAWSGAALLLLGLFPQAATIWIAILFAVYALAIGGAQVLQYIYPNELFPTEIRGTAVGIASSVSRLGAATGTFLVPISLTSLGIGTTMLFAAAITLSGCFVSIKWAPETGGLALHESSAL